jgi:hypothetical protein
LSAPLAGVQHVLSDDMTLKSADIRPRMNDMALQTARLDLVYHNLGGVLIPDVTPSYDICVAATKSPTLPSSVVLHAAAPDNDYIDDDIDDPSSNMKKKIVLMTSSSLAPSSWRVSVAAMRRVQLEFKQIETVKSPLPAGVTLQPLTWPYGLPSPCAPVLPTPESVEPIRMVSLDSFFPFCQMTIDGRLVDEPSIGCDTFFHLHSHENLAWAVDEHCQVHHMKTELSIFYCSGQHHFHFNL